MVQEYLACWHAVSKIVSLGLIYGVNSEPGMTESIGYTNRRVRRRPPGSELPRRAGEEWRASLAPTDTMPRGPSRTAAEQENRVQSRNARRGEILRTR